MPERRISLLRLLIALVIAGGFIAGGSWLAWGKLADPAAETPIWVAPYVDTTLTPVFHFEDPLEQPSDAVVLGFVVADTADPCLPSWGSYYSLDAAARALDLDRRIVRLRERGGDAIVSFGGALNHELATVCSDPARLKAAYQSIIDRYHLNVVDFDIEGGAIADGVANDRRAVAIRELQQDNPELKVWFTVPVSPGGMTADGVALIEQTLSAGVSLTGVNFMTMDYGGAKPASVSMRDATESALNATFQQLDGIFQRLGTPLTQAQIWKMIGATPMIGQNDVPDEVFTTDDAAWLLRFAGERQLGRISYWSANRDAPCGSGGDDRRVSNTCSGVVQEARQFGTTFASNSTTDAVAAEEGLTEPIVPQTSGSRADNLNLDDPRTSPYPLWRPAKVYEADAKVVWQGRVYQAKWWTQGDQPDAPVEHVWDTPWRYLGPVLAMDRAAVIAITPAPDGVRPLWNSEAVYVAGDEVEYEMKAYRAKWWTQGDVPQEDPDQPYDHPWEYLGQIKIGNILEGTPAPGDATPTPVGP